MNDNARITSIEAVPRLRSGLQKFAEEALSVLSDVDMELGRILEWIGHDRREYWAGQARRASDRTSEARIALDRRRLMTKVDGAPPSCDEEKKALASAQRRLRVSEEKVDAVRRWRQILDHEITDTRAVLSQLASWLQVEYPQANATLERLYEALDAYVALETPIEAAPLPPTAGEGTSDTPAAENSPATVPIFAQAKMGLSASAPPPAATPPTAPHPTAGAPTAADTAPAKPEPAP